MEPRKFRQYLERFSAQLAKLSQRQRAGMAALLNRSLLQEQTAAQIEASSSGPRLCPRCHSSQLHRHGHAAGLQRYRCANCAHLPNYLGWRWALDGGRIGSPELLLRSALGHIPHATVT